MARLVVGNGWTCACDREKCSTECEYYLDFMSVKTNGDKIRAMNDEELAKYLWSIRNAERCVISDQKRCIIFDDCIACWLDWLKQGAER